MCLTGPEPLSTNPLRRVAFATTATIAFFYELARHPRIADAIAAVTERFRVELPDGFRLRSRQTPTLGPSDGLPVRVRVARGPRED